MRHRGRDKQLGQLHATGKPSCAGSLEALAVFKDKPDTEIVLGLLSSKTNTLDDEARVVQMLDEVSKIINKDRLLLSRQCGFASCDGGNELTEDEQWAKIKQGQQIAQQYGVINI